MNQTGVKDRYQGTIFSQGPLPAPQNVSMNPVYTPPGSMGPSLGPNGMLRNPPLSSPGGVPMKPLSPAGMSMIPSSGLAPGIRTDLPPTEWWEQELKFLALEKKRQDLKIVVKCSEAELTQLINDKDMRDQFFNRNAQVTIMKKTISLSQHRIDEYAESLRKVVNKEKD